MAPRLHNAVLVSDGTSCIPFDISTSHSPCATVKIVRSIFAATCQHSALTSADNRPDVGWLRVVPDSTSYSFQLYHYLVRDRILLLEMAVGFEH